MADAIFYVRDAKTGELFPIKARGFADDTYSIDVAVLMLLDLTEVNKWQTL
jgi:hypothetical protein